MKYSSILQGINPESVLQKLNIEYTSYENELRFLCPNPFHHDTEPSMYLNKKDLVFNCFGCDWKGNILTLISLVLNITYEQTLDWLQGFNLFDYKQILYNKIYKRIHSVSLSPEENPLYIPPLKSLNFDNRKIIYFFKKRHLHPRICHLYGMKICVEGYYKNRIIIPIISNSKLYGFEARTIINDKDKVLYPPKSMVKSIVYDIDQLDYNEPLYFCEGLMDCLSLKSRGFLHSSCSFGNQISKKQIKILSHFKKIIVIPDSDEGGNIFISNFNKIKGPQLEVIHLPNRDIDELEKYELYNILS